MNSLLGGHLGPAHSALRDEHSGLDYSAAVAVVLAVLAALSYGVGDFAGGLASRSRNAINVLVLSYPVGGALMLALAPLFGGHLSLRTAVFGALGGMAGMVGVIVMYSLMEIAPMNVVSPVTAVLAAIVPIGVGVADGEKPATLTWLAIVLGLVAVCLIGRTDDSHPHGRVGVRVLALSLISGIGFGLYFVFLARADSNSGLWPLVISRLTSALLILPIAARQKMLHVFGGSTLALTVTAGVLDASANLFFLLSARHGYLSVAAMITSLYPAATVLLAVTVLREHTTKWQRVGLALGAACVVLIAR